MNLLSKVTGGKRGRAQRVVIFGPEGIGKSTLASQFPSPLFLDVEDSTDQLSVRRLSREDLPTLQAFESALDEVISTRPCATLVVDTVDRLEALGEADVIAAAKTNEIQSIEDFGYGKGFVRLRERLTITLARLDRVIDAGIHVVLLAHSKVQKFEPPDNIGGPYDRYELKLSKHVAPLIKEWSDMLLFGNWRIQVRERNTKKEAGQKFKAVGGTERKLYCNRTAAWDAKNRHGLGDEAPWEIATIEKAFRDVHAPWGVTPQSPEPVKTHVAQGDPAKGPSNVGEPPEIVSSPAPVSLAEPADAPIDLPSDLSRICEPHAEAITRHLIARGEIKQGQTWADMPARYAARVMKRPAEFIRAVLANGGKP